MNLKLNPCKTCGKLPSTTHWTSSDNFKAEIRCHVCGYGVFATGMQSMVVAADLWNEKNAATEPEKPPAVEVKK